MKKRIIIIISVLIIIVLGILFARFNSYRYAIKDNGDIKHLNSNNIHILKYYPNLKYVTASEVTKIEGLKTLKLEYLNLWASESLSRIEGLEEQSQLTRLYLTDNNIWKIGGFKGLKHIRRIDLSNDKITVIENIETIPLVENTYCYMLENPDETKLWQYENDKCFIEEPKTYYKRYLVNENYEYGEMVSPLSYIELYGNDIEYITKESLEYIEKYNIDVGLNNLYTAKTREDFESQGIEVI